KALAPINTPPDDQLGPIIVASAIVETIGDKQSTIGIELKRGVETAAHAESVVIRPTAGNDRPGPGAAAVPTEENADLVQVPYVVGEADHIERVRGVDGHGHFTFGSVWTVAGIDVGASHECLRAIQKESGR